VDGCSSASSQEAHIRALLLQAASSVGPGLRRLTSENLEDSPQVTVSALLVSASRNEAALEQIIGRMAQVNAIGHDKRGNTIFKRNEDGAEILMPFEPSKTAFLERTADGSASVRPLPRERVIDDDTPEIAAEFSKWKMNAVLGW